MKDERRRRVKRIFLPSLLLTAALCSAAPAGAEGRGKPAARSIEGMIYFTNDSPKDHSFLVELFDAKLRRVAVKWTEQSGYFEFKGLRPGTSYLQVSGAPRICLLQYEVDARRRQPESLTILGDAGCGHHQVAGLPAPRPVPRRKKR